MRKIFQSRLPVILILCTLSAAHAQEFRLDGTWFTRQKESLNLASVPQKEFGWGTGLSVPNSYLEIDTVKGTLYVPGLFTYTVVAIQETGPGRYSLTAYFANGDFQLVFHVNFLSEDTMWLEYEGPGQLGGDVGREHVYYRISGPAP